MCVYVYVCTYVCVCVRVYIFMGDDRIMLNFIIAIIVEAYMKVALFISFLLSRLLPLLLICFLVHAMGYSHSLSFPKVVASIADMEAEQEFCR